MVQNTEDNQGELAEASSSSVPQSLPPPAACETRFASVSLYRINKIRLLKFTENVKTAIRQIIASSGYTSVKAEETSPHGGHKFKMAGSPWYAFRDDVVHSARLMNHIIGELFNMGWLLTLSTDIILYSNNLDTLVFRHQLPPPPRCE
ncbi:hypothetical protein PG990_006440 [Apiospora arundinis]|uniref:Uncharacterized protein n=1 Tax=Apiospora arundinis TaxID=335852 RepID=A0ABR2JA58_9PEZI